MLKWGVNHSCMGALKLSRGHQKDTSKWVLFPNRKGWREGSRRYQRRRCGTSIIWAMAHLTGCSSNRRPQWGNNPIDHARKVWANVGNAKQWSWAYTYTEMCKNLMMVQVAQGSVKFDENWIFLNGGWTLEVNRILLVLRSPSGLAVRSYRPYTYGSDLSSLWLNNA